MGVNDAYNAAPSSMKAALNFIRETTMKDKKWIVLGDMLELGDDEQSYHEGLSKYISDNLKGVCLYGPRMKWLYDELKPVYGGKLIWSENDYAPIVDFLKKYINNDAVILVKGSRGMALENVIEPFTAQ